MGECLESGSLDKLNEYTIATEVLGRSKSVFNSSEDAIVRVEAHRLRKRLANYYQAEGKEHPLRVTLPAGSYMPVFVLYPLPRPAESELNARLAASRETNHATPTWLTSRAFVFTIAGVVLAAAAFVFYIGKRWEQGSLARVDHSNHAAIAEDPSAAIRLMAGYSGPPRIDSAGRVWSADAFYTGGGSWQRSSTFMSRTSDPFLFDHSRTGDFSYGIPLKPGRYEVHLYFSTPLRWSDSISTFNVAINGFFVLSGFDINVDALGADIADERVFRDIVPGPDGRLHIVFSGGMGPPTLNAIEILPGTPHAQLPIRLIMQTAPLLDREGQTWLPDNYFMGGRLANQLHPLSNSPDPDLFSGERYGHFTYALPVDTRGTYTLVLHFVEFYFTSPSSGSNGRLFNVMCNGKLLLGDFDVYKEAGGMREISKTFRHLKPSAQGKLNLTFEPIANNATVSGIEVLDESR